MESMISCPTDQETMKEFSFEGVKLYRCPKCENILAKKEQAEYILEIHPEYLAYTRFAIGFVLAFIILLLLHRP